MTQVTPEKDIRCPGKTSAESRATRRDFLKGAFACGAGALLLPLSDSPLLDTLLAQEDRPDDVTRTLSVVEGDDPSRMTQEAIALLGGIDKFVRKDQVVVVKPSIAWDRAPEMAANTNPDVVAAIVKECLDAGAREVKVFDRPVHPATRTYEASGIAEAARKAGAKILYVDDEDKAAFRDLKLPKGKVINSWPIFAEALDADVLINVPIAKHHGLSKLTLGIKNLMGTMGGNRSAIHPKIHQCLADILTELRPHLTVLDAYRILVAHGPQGGSAEDVRLVRMVVTGIDPVAVDSFATTLPGFDMKGEDVGYIKISHGMGLGEIDLRKLRILRKRI